MSPSLSFSSTSFCALSDDNSSVCGEYVAKRRRRPHDLLLASQHDHTINDEHAQESNVVNNEIELRTAINSVQSRQSKRCDEITESTRRWA